MNRKVILFTIIGVVFVAFGVIMYVLLSNAKSDVSGMRDYSLESIELSDIKNFIPEEDVQLYIDGGTISQREEPEPHWYVLTIMTTSWDYPYVLAVVYVDDFGISDVLLSKNRDDIVGVPASVRDYVVNLPYVTPDADAPETSDNPTYTRPLSSSWQTPISLSENDGSLIIKNAYGVQWGTTKHAGEDFEYEGDILSICNGTVVRLDNKGDVSDYGNYASTNSMIVDCGGGMYAKYSHYYYRTVPSSVRVGRSVSAGTKLAQVGDQGDTPILHLHLEVRSNKGDDFDLTFNPLIFLREKGVIIEQSEQ